MYRPGSLSVDVKQNGGNAQILPTSWLSPSAQVLPTGWQLGIDPDGDLNYDHLSANASTVTLSDSTGDTHVYTWTGTPGTTTGGSYKPPVNEDGQLTHNSDGSYTLIDTDGKTYVFNTDGTLQSVTNPVDDLKPAALRYDYAGTPAHIVKISDGVDSSRYAAVYYSGDSNCTAPPDSSFGQTHRRRSLSCDDLGRATAVTAPAATQGATRQQQTIEYLPYATPLRRAGGSGDRTCGWFCCQSTEALNPYSIEYP